MAPHGLIEMCRGKEHQKYVQQGSVPTKDETSILIHLNYKGRDFAQVFDQIIETSTEQIYNNETFHVK